MTDTFRTRLAAALAPSLTRMPPDWTPAAPAIVRTVGEPATRIERLSDTVTLYLGDSRTVTPTVGPVHACVTDPPYALVSIVKRFGKPGAAPAQVGATGAYARASAGFMGQTWDTGETAHSLAFWASVLDALPPGGHVVAAAGTRTYHRLACAVEDAGFEIRDMVSWLYGSGFPKSLDVSAAIDKAAGAVRERTGAARMRTDDASQVAPNLRCELCGLARFSQNPCRCPRDSGPITDEAREWDGWGTALKPACEPWVLARRPLAGTVAANVLAHRTGGLNIDACRVSHDEPCRMMAPSQANIDHPSEKHRQAGWREATLELKPGGRWPANVAHDGSDAVLAGFPDAKGQQGNAVYGAMRYARTAPEPRIELDTSAARFFYCAKASKADRGDDNGHPTVKPHDFMRWACRLVTPPSGVVFDPFMGSGSTGKAAVREGFGFVGIERDPAYFEIALRRIEHAVAQART